ncbi:MAG: PAS domain S-box protein [Pelomonas sp.]|nr:PAS domain S-box protein [Roseateles sp.]
MLPLLGLAVWLGYDFVRATQAGAEHASERLVHNVASAIDHELEARMGGLRMLASSTLATDVADWPRLYREALAYRDGFGSDVIFVDLEERVRFHTARPLGESTPPLPRPVGRSAVAAAAASGRPAAGDLFFDGPAGHEPMLALAAPGLRDGQLAFMMVSVLPAAQFARRLDEFAVPPGWTLSLIDSRGDEFARSRGARKDASGGESPAPSDAGDKPAPGSVDRVVLPMDTVPWSLVLEVPREDNVGPIVRAALAMALAVLGATLAGALGGDWASGRLARSVRALVEQSPAPLGVEGGITEIDTARAMLDRSQGALRLREAQLRGIVDSASEAILTADAGQTIVMANAAAARTFGTGLAELVGRPLESLIPPRFRERHRQAIAAYGQTGNSARAMGRGGPQLHALRADGTEFPIEAAISQVVVDGQQLFTVILRDISERLRTERALQDSHVQLQRLLAAHDRVQEEERKRVARELHDDLQQTLAAVLMETQLARAGLEGGQGAAAGAALERLNRLAAGAIASTRRIVNDLRPQMLEELGLVAALEQLAQRFAQQTGLACGVQPDHFTSQEGPHGSAVDLCLFRVAQEALNNVAKHAQARHVTIRLAITPGGHRTLTVRDDGRGIEASDQRREGSFGLLGMAERVHAIGGTLRIEGRAGHGTLVRVDVPPEPASLASAAVPA